VSNKIDILEDEKGLSIQIGWFQPMAYFLLVVATVWSGGIFFFISNLWSANAPLFAKLAPLAHVAVAIYLVYTVSAMFLNKTYLELDDESLKVHHDPLPWFKGKKNIRLDEIKQLYVKENRSTRKGKTYLRYELRAKLFNGMDEAVLKLKHLESHDLFTLEEKLENYLGIKDKYVKGEFAAKSREENLSLDGNPLNQREASILKSNREDEGSI